MNTLFEAILDKINKDELARLAVELAGIYSPPGNEADVGNFVFEWLKKYGIRAEKIGMVSERFSVVGRLKGGGNGYSIMFNSHMDQANSRKDWLTLVNPENPVYYESRVEGDRAVGSGVVNDKGPMAAFLIAAKAIKESGVQLKGDLVVAAVPGEIGQEPIDEFQGFDYLGKDLGARYMANHGIVTDFVLVAECTGFCPIWVEAGKAFFKISVFGEPSVYSPFLKRPTSLEKSPNAIPRMARVIEEVEKWAYEYETRKSQEYPGGKVVPKVNIGAIRGGLPYKLSRTSEVCSIYLDVRLLPGEGPLDAQLELQSLIEKVGIPAEVKLTLYRRGYEANNIDRLLETLQSSHTDIIGSKPGRAIPAYSSMWRDINAFNEIGIPSLTYGPTARSSGEESYVTTNDLFIVSKIYALTALNLCMQVRK